MSSTPTCTLKKTHCVCVKSLMPASIRTVRNTKSPFSGYSRRKSLSDCIKSRDTIIRKKVRGNITPGRNLKGLKIDLRTSEKINRVIKSV